MIARTLRRLTGTVAGRRDWVVSAWRHPADETVVLRREHTKRAARRWLTGYLLDLDDPAVTGAVIHADTARPGRDLTPLYPGS